MSEGLRMPSFTARITAAAPRSRSSVAGATKTSAGVTACGSLGNVPIAAERSSGAAAARHEHGGDRETDEEARAAAAAEGTRRGGATRRRDLLRGRGLGGRV